MREQQPSLLRRRVGTGLAALVAVLCLLLMTTVSALANTVNIYDNAGVLNASQVRSAASSLSYNVDVYSISGFNGSTSAFNQAAASKIPNPNTIVIAFETNPKHVAIVGGKSVNLSSSQYNDAVNAFVNDFKSNSNYSSATVAALRSLSGSSGNSGGFAGSAPGGGFGIGGGTFCCIGLLVLGALFFAFRSRIFRGNRMGGMGGTGYNQPYNQPYNQGGYPPNYGPGYNQGQGGGMNPWAAGGLGAAAGGLVGYELGKEQGEQQGNQGNYGNGGDFGGGASGDFGSGNGGGGDFGGGAGGDFGGGGGGGGDFGGGGGGGGDFGGGSGGDF